MKKVLVSILVFALILSLCACGAGAPAKVSEYAKRHELEVLSPEQLKSRSVVGKDYVVFGTVSSISFANYEKDSADLAERLSDLDGLAREVIRENIEGTMSYRIVFTEGPPMYYDDYNSALNMLKINEDDEVAFVVTCEDGYTAGTYRYSIKEKIWEARHSETTIEEDHDAEARE